MLATFIALIINTAIVFFVSYILPGVKLSSLFPAIVIAVILGLINAFVHHLLDTMTVPTNYFTYGLTSFILSAIVLAGISYILPGFEVDSLYWIVVFALILGLSNGLIHSIVHY